MGVQLRTHVKLNSNMKKNAPFAQSVQNPPKVNDKFTIIVDRSLITEEIVLLDNALVAAYPVDLKKHFSDEFLFFLHMAAKKTTVADILKVQTYHKLNNSFKNVFTAVGMYLAILGTKCKG